MRVQTLIWMMFLTGTLGAEPISLSREAEAFFEAGEYGASGERYRSLLSEDLSPQQRSLVQYNLATVYLHEGKWVEANEIFHGLLKDESPSPLLRRDTATNLSVLLLRQVLAMDKTLDNEEDPLRKTEQAISLLEEALKWMGAAEEAEQQWLVAQGSAEFSTSADLSRTRAAIKTALVEWRQRYRDYQVADIEGGLDRLGQAVDGSRHFLEELAEAKLDGDQLGAYLEREASLQKQSLKLWGVIRSRLQESLTEREQELTNAPEREELQQAVQHFRGMLDLLSEGENRHLEARDALREKRLWLSRERLALAELYVTLTRGLQNNQDPIEGILQHRVELKDRLQQDATSDELIKSLSSELATIDPLAIAGLDQVQERLRISQADITQDRLRIESELHSAILAALVANLGRPHNEPHLAYQNSIYDWLTYRQFKETEAAILSRLYISLDLLTNKKLNQADEAAAAEMAEAEVQVLMERLRIRASLAGAEDRDRSNRVRSTLEKVSKLPSTDFASRRDGIEEALLLWDPLALLRQHLAGMQRQYRLILKQADLSSREIGLLDPDYSRLSRWLEQLDERVIEADTLDKLLDAVSHAGGYQKRGTALVDDGRVRSARVVLGAADRQLGLARGLLDPAGAKPPVQVLAEMVEQEQSTVSINQLLKQVDRSEGTYDLLLEILQEAQGVAIDMAEKFPGSVERSDPQQRSIDALKEEAPWDEVLSLYQQGLKEAELAQALLLLPTAELARALQNEMEAYRLWEEALRKLKDPSNEGQPDKDEGQGEPDEGDQEESEEQGPQDSGIQSVLERLQEMDQDDALDSKQAVPVKRGLRPW